MLQYKSNNDFNSKSSFACALSGASAVSDDRSGVLVGVWLHIPDLNGNGIKITTDGGRRWQQHNGNTGEAAARYGNNKFSLITKLKEILTFLL